MKSVIVGTAGHIDHGKTALVRALTGIDADRLEEEKRRGITIDIGFAHLELPSPDSRGENLRLGFVDVPGHEKFVRNMLAGIGGIDLVILVVAADEGVKPQTREHFDICRLLSIQRGLTVITKSDLVDADTLEVVRLELEDFVKGSFLDAARSPIVPVSALKGDGLDTLKTEIARIAGEATAKDSRAAFRLPIDRVFTMKGHGTVITGTLISGAVKKEEDVEVLPGGKRLRVRGVQVHGKQAEQAIAGERTALNLAGVSPEELARGMVLAHPGMFRATKRVDVQLNLLPTAKPLKDRARVHVHCYTAETVADVVLLGDKPMRPGSTGWAQLRLAEPILALPGDRFILRQFSPVITIGGGVVADAAPLKKRIEPEERALALRTFLGTDDVALLQARVARCGTEALMFSGAIAETGWTTARVDVALKALISEKQALRFADALIAVPAFDEAKSNALAALKKFHDANPLVAGISKQELRERLDLRPEIFTGVLDALGREKKIEVQGEQVRLAGRGVQMRDDEAESKQQIEDAFKKAGLQVPALKDVLAGLKVDRTRAQKIMTLLLRDKVLVKLSDDLVFHAEALNALKAQVKTEKAKSTKIDVARFKELTGVSRKYAIPLLEYLDREKVTRRVGDAREIF
jgi:selenocysteine-specific elongation factor